MTDPSLESNTFPRTGVAYIAAIEHEYLSANKFTVCNKCLAMGMDKPLKRCNGCMLVDYCGKECQRSDWRRHKGFCGMVRGRGRRDGYLTEMGRRDGGKEEVGRVVIDAYRLRMEMDHGSRGEDHGVYWDEGKRREGNGLEGLVWAEGDVLEDFQRWLNSCEETGVLPEWWRFEDRMEVLAKAVDREGEEGLWKTIDQEGLITRYEGDTGIRNALSVLAELVVGYEGKGRAKSDEWYMHFSEFLDLHPGERARLIKGTVDAVEGARAEGGVLGKTEEVGAEG